MNDAIEILIGQKNEALAERDALAKRIEELTLERQELRVQLIHERDLYNALRQSVGNVIGITGLAEQRAGRAK